MSGLPFMKGYAPNGSFQHARAWGEPDVALCGTALKPASAASSYFTTKANACPDCIARSTAMTARLRART